MITISEAKRIVTDMFVLGSFEDFTVEQIIELLTLADDQYFNETDNEPILDDVQYDALKQYAQRLAPTDVYFTGVGSSVRGGKVKLPYTMGSLNQVYLGDFVKWVAKQDPLSVLVYSDKLDGASNMTHYNADGLLQIAYSRGDGERGADITRHVSQIHNVPKKIDNGGEAITIRAETIISPASFKKLLALPKNTLRREYKNPRNAVSGMMNASTLNPVVYQYIDVVAYEIVGSKLSKQNQLKKLQDLGFKVAFYDIAVAGEMTDEKWTSLLKERREVTEYEIDGLVIEYDDPRVRQSMTNPSSLNPEYAVKFKVADASNVAIATVLNVEWNISKDGFLKPRVQIEPVELVGVTVQHATGFNAKFIKDNKIGTGAKVRIIRSGDVIPYITDVVEPASEAQMPEEDAIWSPTGVDLIVANVADNATAKFESLNDFFATLSIMHLGEGTLQQMFDRGFETPESIITLTLEDLQSLVGSRPNGKKIFDSLRTKFTNIPMYELMGAFPAFGRGVGVRKMKLLHEAFKGDMTKAASAVEIIQVDGFDKKTVTKIVNGYEPFQDFVAKIDKYVTFAVYEPPKEGVLKGKSVVVTGFRDKSFEARIVELGGKLSTAVSSSTAYVVAQDTLAVSTKLTKARELGIPVMSKDEFLGAL